ncbi:alpha-2-macroglobulin family protein [Paraflavitalea sp. CAU 1676]|uniref:alpha-2-macroglobulin family protein n=1 Tax=Paraflavitalea sp. CAU 1676 TaxID=3032598 RepID=UPI0023DB90E5|nr:alpha-2-macroglobulin family protein [Paraflavitalea sp. CAU 1676]MDF2189400.1 alpha-2-macroglobulin family protein [Paraflavitalea sp. CAU 1676]
MPVKKVCFLVLATLFLFTATGQQKMNNYDKAWKKIDSLIEQKGLPTSALTEVNKLYALAQQEKNDAQLIKALIYRARLRDMKEENADQKTIAAMEAEIAKATGPAKAILQSQTASMYWMYLQQNRWKFYNRTTTVNFAKTDIDTWSIDDLNHKISELYLASLQQEKQLKEVKLETFEPIIIKGNMRHLRPTLFDLLANQALEYFKTDERNLNKPADAFEINDAAAFADARSFATHRFIIADTSSLHGKALQLYQRLITFHLTDAKPDALIDIDIDRLEFVHTYSVQENKKELYRKALQQLTATHGKLPTAAQAWYLLAGTYSEEAASYHPLKDTTHRFAYLKALEICESVVAQKEESEGQVNCFNLVTQIRRASVNLQTERVNIPNQPFRVSVSYRNITQLHFRVVKFDKKTKDDLGTDTYNEEYWKKLAALPVIKSFAQTLPDTKDFQQHRVEVKADGLPVGEYAFFVSSQKDFSTKDNVLAVQAFYTSNLAYINKGNDYIVLDRETGAPIARAGVQVYYRAYDYADRKNKERKGENLFTDKNGFFALYPPKSSNDNYYRIEVSTKEDHLSLDEYEYSYRYASDNEDRSANQSYLFTDRAIYRPGQIVYFKGIVINQQPSTNKNAAVANFTTEIDLFDVNGQLVDSIKVTSNAYGSYSGKFTLPTSLLNGQFRLQDKSTNSSLYFSVEEYKRPRFMTEIAKPAGSYRLNDSIVVKGTAKAYAGNNIDGATVRYRVVRRTIMPLWYGWGRKIWPPYGRETVEVAHGSTTTGTDGGFTITFKALPDLSVDKKDQPTFTYEVSADVTDINGETRSGSTYVSVAYQALRLNIDAANKLHSDSLKQIGVRSTNFNDLFEQARVTLSIYKLKTPERVFRSRYWEQADQYVMTKEEYRALFPYDLYANETEVSTWERMEKVLEVTDTTTASGKFALGKSSLPAGWYVIEVTTKDKFGEPVKAIHYIQLFNKAGESNPIAYAAIQMSKPSFEPGETASFELASNLDNLFVIQDINRRGAKEERKFITLNGVSTPYQLPVTENDRGGLGVQIAFVKHNRVYTQTDVIDIPFTNKQLKIDYTTFRDKTLPGSAEKWKVKISGIKGDQVAAEMLTAMYDASLDQFTGHGWNTPSIWHNYYPQSAWIDRGNFRLQESQEKYRTEPTRYFQKEYDRLMGGNLARAGGGQIRIRGMAMQKQETLMFNSVAPAPEAALPQVKRSLRNDDEKVTYGLISQDGVKDEGIVAPPVDGNQASSPGAIQVRKNFNETAFFFPDLHTDAEGNIEFSFTMPEALTEWKWMTLAHTKDLAFGYNTKSIITQKDLMVQPNAPRFMREGDRMDFSGKIVNLSSKELTGQVELQLIDPTTNQSVDGWFRNVFPNQFFTVAAGQSIPVNFSLEIPYQYNKPVTYRLIPSTKASGNESALSDGEENMLPVVSNRMLVTESLSLPVRGNSTKNFSFDKLIKSGRSETLSQHALTVEFTSNPAWYAVQALPYLMEYPYECAEQVFNRYYANTLATSIANASPRVKAIFERWKTTDTAALLSNLQKNQELKAVLLEETPWVLEAKNEAQQKRNIGLLFDMVRMSKEQESALSHMQDLQSPNGGFVWFQGGPDDRYITQYILTGIGHLQKLNAQKANARISAIVKAAIPYLDKALKRDYDELLKNNKQKEPENGLGYMQIQYLYMRSFFPEQNIPAEVSKAYTYFRKQAQKHWLKQSKYMQGMIALALHRTQDIKTPQGILASLKQNAVVHEEMGMYWKDLSAGYYWYQHPIETQSLLIEAFMEVGKDNKSVADLKTWLLKQKQTQNWKTTKATADACYALLLQGTDWLNHEPTVQINLGSYAIRSNEQTQEAGTGYFKKVIDGKDVKPDMGNIKVTVSGTGAAAAESVSWGAVYWQYFENLDKITTAISTPLKLSKKLFVEKLTDRGPVLQPVNEGDALKVGDKVKVRIELRVDRHMEYVHMKDMRAACLEPVNVLSEYKWQGGLGYYESTKDASTNFFFGSLPKGTWVFEYPLFVTHTGTYSNGITSIQCMYAPEFGSHSEGVKVTVDGK